MEFDNTEMMFTRGFHNGSFRAFQKYVFLISGYDEDSRELYQIPEVVSFIKDLNSKLTYLVNQDKNMVLIKLKYIIKLFCIQRT